MEQQMPKGLDPIFGRRCRPCTYSGVTLSARYAPDDLDPEDKGTMVRVRR
jgi:hypothetical protein